MVVAGLDEALSTMRVGGVRRVYVPGPLSFPKSLKAAAGRPTVPANSPVIFDVSLLYIPGEALVGDWDPRGRAGPTLHISGTLEC
jgi:hypothetical protein